MMLHGRGDQFSQWRFVLLLRRKPQLIFYLLSDFAVSILGGDPIEIAVYHSHFLFLKANFFPKVYINLCYKILTEN